MLSENHVIDAVCGHLESHGYAITQRLTTKQRGHDIIATRCGVNPIELHIEAKGETSDRHGSPRHGKPFDSAQVSDHVAAAFFCAAAMLQEGSPTERLRVGIAFPDTTLHRTYVSKIAAALARLDVAVFWVQPSLQVSIESAWPL